MKKNTITRTAATIITGIALTTTLTACGNNEEAIQEALVKNLEFEVDAVNAMQNDSAVLGKLGAVEKYLTNQTSEEAQELKCEESIQRRKDSQMRLAEMSETEFALQGVGLVRSYLKYNMNEAEFEARAAPYREAEPQITDDGKYATVGNVTLAKEGGKWKVCD